MARKSGIDLSAAAVRKVGKTDAGVGKTAKVKVVKPKPQAKPTGGKWPVHPQNPFGRPSSAYHVCFNILASHTDGLPRERLVELLAKATGSDLVHARYNAQVCLSARGAAGPDLNPFEGPRNRSCRFGFWVKRENSHVQLVLPAASTVSKETP